MKELSVEDKLRAIYDLQLIDSRIEIRNVTRWTSSWSGRSEDEVAGLSTRSDKLKSELKLSKILSKKKECNWRAQRGYQKYTKQQETVRNNREFNSLTKEVEFQELEIQLAEKQMKEMKASIEHKKDVISQSKERLEVKSNHLKHKNQNWTQLCLKLLRKRNF
jgi:DNA-binding response OmpR family regulator